MARQQTYHWTLEQAQSLDRAVEVYGNNWIQVSKAMGGARTPKQCRSHAQKSQKKRPKPSEVFPKNEHRVEAAFAGPFASVGCQYGEGVRFLNVALDEATWRERAHSRILPAEDLYDMRVPLPASSQAISAPEVRRESVVQSTQMRDIGTQWVECKVAMTYEQWYIHSKHLDRKDRKHLKRKSRKHLTTKDRKSLNRKSLNPKTRKHLARKSR